MCNQIGYPLPPAPPHLTALSTRYCPSARAPSLFCENCNLLIYMMTGEPFCPNELNGTQELGLILQTGIRW